MWCHLLGGGVEDISEAVVSLSCNFSNSLFTLLHHLGHDNVHHDTKTAVSCVLGLKQGTLLSRVGRQCDGLAKRIAQRTRSTC